MNDQSHTAFPSIVEGQIGDTVIQTVNARDLHAALGVGKDFSTWIKERISAFEFKENSDFAIFPEFGENPGRGRPAKEYALTLDMAKELAMVERNEAGKRVRTYFIECERKLRERPSAPQMPDLNDPAVLSTLLLQQAQARIEDQRRAAEAEAALAAAQPKIEAHDRLAEAYGSFCRTTAAKMLGTPPNVLIRWLRTNNWTYRRPGDKDDIAYQNRIAAGLLEHKVATGQREDGTDWTSTQVRVTAKGLTVLAKAFPPAAQLVKDPSRRVAMVGIAAVAGVLFGLAPKPTTALPVVAPQTMPALPHARLEVLDHYVAYLAHEHQAALIERGLIDARSDDERERIQRGNVPTGWYPDDPFIVGLLAKGSPSGRALVMLAALGGGMPEIGRMIDRAEWPNGSK